MTYFRPWKILISINLLHVLKSLIEYLDSFIGEKTTTPKIKNNIEKNNDEKMKYYLGNIN